MSHRTKKGRGSPGGRRLSLGKKLAFALLASAAFFVLLEGLLAIAGVRLVLADRDPFVGFASSVPLFVPSDAGDDRGVMTTAPNKLEYFNAQRFERQKPEGTYRIFCMGGSTTYGRPFDDVTSLAAWLRELLPLAQPGMNWEVINAGGISYASYRVATLMEELAGYDPDLFVVYTGHNEFLEERTYSNLQATPPALLRYGAILGKTRTYSLLYGLLQPRQRPDRFELPGEVDAILDHTVGPASYDRDDDLREQVLKHFEINLARMTDVARSAGARIVFVTPACNVKDCAPFKSQHTDGLAASELRQFSELLQRGRTLEQEDNDPAGALAAYQAALEVDDRFAELHYLAGGLLFRAGRLAEATSAFRRAVDEDVCPLRALTSITDFVRGAQLRLNVPVVDFQRLLENECLRDHGHNAPGREYFLDHVHPRVAVNRLMAVAIARRLISEGIVDAEASWTDASWTDADLQRITRRIESRIDPVARATSLKNLAKVLNWAGKHEEAGPLALDALETLPNDPECLVLAGSHLRVNGQPGRAVEYYRKALERSPDYAEAHQLLGAMLAERGDFEDACRHFREVLRIHPDDAEAHHMVGAILVELDRFEEALVSLEKAREFMPQDANVHYNLGLASSKLGRRTQAIGHYARAVELNPRDADAHHNLGVLLAEEEKFGEAVGHYRQALEIKPDLAGAKENLEKALDVRAAKKPQSERTVP